MTTTGTSRADTWLVTGALVLLMTLASWFAGLKSLVVDSATESEADSEVKRPNILLIVADDLGYNDTTLYNATGIPTPNLDALAQTGARFTRHYADATCTPSRVALLSGRYAERSGFRPVGIEIPAEFPTVAQRLAEAGYNTYLTGKWHAGEERIESLPQHKGFPNWFGFLNQWELSGAVTDTNKGGTKKPRYNDPMLRTDGGELVLYPGHLTDILTAHTIDRIDSLSSKEAPWFLYHAFLAPHHPIEPAPRYRERFDETPEGAYRALVTQLDDALGNILDAIDRDNTLVVFLSDNGGTNKQRDNNYPFHGKKGDELEGAYRTPLVISWPGHIEENSTFPDIVMNVDVYPTLLAAAGAAPEPDIDGYNLWPTLAANAAMPARSRSWEVYSENVGTLNYSYLSSDGNRRLSVRQGFINELYHLDEDKTGSTNVAEQHIGAVSSLQSEFETTHWAKSKLAVNEQRGDGEGIVHYTGLDAMRSPFLFGSTIGLELGPLDMERTAATSTVLAQQGTLWKVVYAADRGLEWHIGDDILRDAHFDPRRCNRVVLTHFFEPVAHLAVRDPKSQIKLYSDGQLRDYNKDFDHRALDVTDLAEPTTVFHDGRAEFYNMVVSAFADPYTPRVREQFVDIYTQLHAQGQLSIADVKHPTSRLCVGER